MLQLDIIFYLKLMRVLQETLCRYDRLANFDGEFADAPKTDNGLDKLIETFRGHRPSENLFLEYDEKMHAEYCEVYAYIKSFLGGNADSSNKNYKFFSKYLEEYKQAYNLDDSTDLNQVTVYHQFFQAYLENILGVPPMPYGNFDPITNELSRDLYLWVCMNTHEDSDDVFTDLVTEKYHEGGFESVRENLSAMHDVEIVVNDTRCGSKRGPLGRIMTDISDDAKPLLLRYRIIDQIFVLGTSLKKLHEQLTLATALKTERTPSQKSRRGSIPMPVETVEDDQLDVITMILPGIITQLKEIKNHYEREFGYEDPLKPHSPAASMLSQVRLSRTHSLVHVVEPINSPFLNYLVQTLYKEMVKLYDCVSSCDALPANVIPGVIRNSPLSKSPSAPNLLSFKHS